MTIGWASTAFAQERKLAGWVRAGTEFDNNALRQEVLNDEDPIKDFVGRYFANLSVVTSPIPRGLVAVDMTHGGKFFFNTAQADTLLTQVAVTYRQRVDNSVGVFLNIDVKDRTERESIRDYNRGGVGGGFELNVLNFHAQLGGAARYFAFKPSAENSSSSFEGNARLDYAFAREFSVGTSYTLGQRQFDTPAFDREGDAIIPDLNTDRSDVLHLISGSVAYRGPLVVDVLYYFMLNQSNSYGQNLSRHAVEITVTAPLFWEIFLTGHLEIQRTSYEDPVLIDALFIIDEENRNSLIASLARPFDEHWEIELRYSLFLEEFGVGDDYQRHTLLTALGYLF